MAGPFYVAWVEPEETTFGPEHEVEDEIFESFKIAGSEGSIPSLTIRFKNTGEGPLAPGRQRWMWLSWESGGTDGIIPLFFGQVLAVPSDILGNVIEYKLYAKDARYDENLRALADTMRVAPFYDEVFIDPSRKDDPDAVLEGYSKLWHVDRTPNANGVLEVTASDVLIGEDGTDPEEFTEAELEHDKVSIQIAQNPLTSVTVKASVPWTQTHTGTIDTGARAFATYAGPSVVSSWPKPGTSMGGGWTAAISGAVDTSAGSESADVEPMITYTYTYTNNAKRHRNGDVMSTNESRTVPKPGVNATLRKTDITYSQSGLIDPYAVDEEGDPAPRMIPLQLNTTTTYVLGGDGGGGGVHTALVVRYDAERPRTENLLFQVYADLQPIITESGTSDIITLSGNDVGIPLLRLETWNDVAGGTVGLGRLIFPSYPGFPGARIPQRATTAGTAGTVLPDFSETEGDTTVDNSVVWTSLGIVYPDSSAEDWTAEVEVPVGRIILPRVPSVVSYAVLMQSGLIKFPQTGTAVSEGQIVRTLNGSYQICTVSGVTERRGANYGTLFSPGISLINLYVTPVEPGFSATWGVPTVDGSVTWVSLGTSVPDGTVQYICIDDGTAGMSGALMPSFPSALGASVIDGTVTWVNIGTAEIPIGGVPGNVSASHYFPTDRGLESIAYCINVARARLLYRSRVVQISFDCRFERAVDLSCRKNAIINDRRLPGGQALGKIIAYSMEVDGPAGVMKGSVTIGCAIGAGDEVVAVAGTPVYVDGVFNDGEVQQSDGAILILPTVGDIGYTPPVAVTVDDGLVFPLTPATAILKSQVHGTISVQTAALTTALNAPIFTSPFPSSPEIGLTIDQQERRARARQDAIEQEIADNPYWYELQLPNVTNGPFNADYSVATTEMMVPRMIDLEAT